MEQKCSYIRAVSVTKATKISISFYFFFALMFQSKHDSDSTVLVKFDFTTALPLRDKNGRCIKISVGE